MFSYMTRQVSAARPIAVLLIGCVLTRNTTAQDISPPLPSTTPIPAAGPVQSPTQTQTVGPIQTPGQSQTPGVIQSTGPIQSPGEFQTPGLIQTPGAVPNTATQSHSTATDLTVPSDAQPVSNELIHHIQAPSERMEMTVNASRILTLDQNIPRAQVNNHEILELTALSPNEIQVLAKKAGVTQINLWNDKGQIYTIDCVVYGDARELSELLRSEFPAANLRVRPMASSVLLTGFVDRADQVSQIIQIAQDYYPKVVPNIQVGGVQQILLHVKVAEVSRTKARELGFDFASINSGSFLASSVSNLLVPGSVAGTVATPLGAGDTVRFGLVKNNTAFFGFLDALRKEDLLKILADPTLVTVSGRPAQFKVGGEIPYPANSTLNGVSVSYKDTGITVDFVPVVLGNGNIRLEVRPIERDLDPTQSFEIAPNVEAPAFTLRQVDTGVEMRAGQTLAIAGLVQKKLNAEKREIPWLGEMPYIGAAFRQVKQTSEEVELLFLVTPEIVQALDPCEVPRCFPSMHTDDPNDCQLYLKGYDEVPSKGPCGPGGGCTTGCGFGDFREGPGYGPEGAPLMGPQPAGPGAPEMFETVPSGPPTPARPTSSDAMPADSSTSNSINPSSRIARLPNPATPTVASPVPAADIRYNPSAAQNPHPTNGTNPSGGSPGFIGPVGYDVLN